MTKKNLIRNCSALGCSIFSILSSNVSADLVLHWKLDEAAGTTATDSSGNALDGIWQETQGSPGWMPTSGVLGGAITFSGSGSDAFIADELAAVMALPFTTSTWVKTVSTQNDTMVYLGDGTTNNAYYTTKVQGGAVRVVARNGGELQVGGGAVSDGEWHHVVSVYTSPTDRAIYVDGLLGATHDVEVLELIPNRFGIGALTRGTGPVDQFTGELDDVALWDRAFTAVDAAALNGLGILGAGNAGDLDPLVDGFAAQGTAQISFRTWEYATGLVGAFGEIGGTVGTGDAYILLDDLGNGMQMSSDPQQPVINSFEASELVIFLGGTTTLLWDVSGADSIDLDQGIGPVANPSGSVDVSPTETTTYTLTATNGIGSLSPELTITVIADPVVTSFTATPNIVYAGEDVTLAWDADNYTTIEIDQGVEAITEPSGAVLVNPTETTTYTFTATNDNGTTTSEATVTVFPVPPARELLLHWPLDEGTGMSAADSANDNDGTFLETGGAITWTDGLMGGGLQFPNLNDVAVEARGALVESYPFSMATWVKTTSLGNDTFAVLGTGTGNDYYSLRMQNGVSNLTRRAGGTFAMNGTNIADDQWHLVVGVFTHDQKRELYIDGVLVNQSETDTGVFSLPDRFSIGALNRADGNVVDAFDGVVDDTSFWKGILSAEEVAALYGGATGLGLNASDIASLLNGFETQSGAQAAGVSWSFVSGLTGEVGTTGGSVDAGDGFIVLDAAGNGMLSSPLDLAIISVELGDGERTITWKSNSGSTYALQFSPDLQDWSDEVDDNIVATGTETSFVDTDPTRNANSVGFYRVLIVPVVN
ncbi:LamG domain-containing protein [Akkermansiaceae bacterium]|nr:LamG domain-containing protein [Akkermansiaceae bacterium]